MTTNFHCDGYSMHCLWYIVGPGSRVGDLSQLTSLFWVPVFLVSFNSSATGYDEGQSLSKPFSDHTRSHNTGIQTNRHRHTGTQTTKPKTLTSVMKKFSDWVLKNGRSSAKKKPVAGGVFTCGATPAEPSYPIREGREWNPSETTRREDTSDSVRE